MEYTVASCGCKVIVPKGKTPPEVLYCPKHKATPELYEALKALRMRTQSLTHRKHHSLCYGLDIEAHPDCELCKIIKDERKADQTLAKAEGKTI